jgi:hypothetical protein
MSCCCPALRAGGGGGSLMGPSPGGGAYLLLALAHAGLAATAFVAPELVVNTFFPGDPEMRGRKQQQSGRRRVGMGCIHNALLPG